MRNKTNSTQGLTSMIDELFNTSFQDIVGASIHSGRPAANISKTEYGYEIELAAPGYDKTDFEIEVKENHLQVSSQREVKAPTDEHIREEFTAGAFSRSFRLSKDIDRENVKASYTDGILKITLRRLEEKAVNTALTIPVG